MSTAALAKVALPALERFGRWLLPRLIRWGFSGVVQFVRYRIDVLTDRRARLVKRKAGKGTKGRTRRLAWLAWRIKWRKRLLVWIKGKGAKLTGPALEAFERAYKKQIRRVPWDRIGERFQSWRPNLAA